LQLVLYNPRDPLPHNIELAMPVELEPYSGLDSELRNELNIGINNNPKSELQKIS
jgi:hypothetical protein